MASGVFFKGGKIVGAETTGDTNTFLAQTFENASLTDFTHTGLVLETGGASISGTTSAKLVHQSAVSQSFKEVKEVSEKYRGSPMSVVITAKSAASFGNVTVLFRDETNDVNIQSTQQIHATSIVQVFQFGVKIPANCLSFSYTITALPEAGSPVTYIDDVTINSAWMGSSVQGQTEYSFEVPSTTSWESFTPSSLVLGGFGTVTNWNGRWRRVGDSMQLAGTFNVGTVSATPGTLPLPAGYTVDTAKVSSANNALGQVENAGAFGLARAVFYSVSNAKIQVGIGETGGGATGTLDNRNASTYFGAGTGVSFNFTVPIAGWGATQTKKVVTSDIVPAKAMSGNMSVDVPITTAWINAGPIVLTATTTSPTKGIVVLDKFWWRRNGDTMEARVEYLQSTAGTAGSGDYLISLPVGYEIDISKLSADEVSEGGSGSFSITNNLGSASLTANTSIGVGTVSAYNSTKLRVGALYTNESTVGTGVWSHNWYATTNPDLCATLEFRVPIKGWAITETKTFSPTQSVVTDSPDSMIRVEGINGYGSTATTIRRFSNLIKSMGSDISYIDSSVDGASFVVQTSGIYSITYSDNFTTADSYVGISKNASSLSANIGSLVAEERLAVERTSSTNDFSTVVWTGYLDAGDVIRPHTSGVTNANALGQFTVTKQGSVKLVQTVSDQKIIIPTSELRFEGASTRGTGVEVNTVTFTTLAKIQGDALVVDSSNGTRITVLKDGIVSISGSVYFNTNGYVYVTKNQVTSSASVSEFMTGSGNNSSAPVCSLSGTFKVKAGDILRVYSPTAAPTANAGTIMTVAHQEQQVAVAVTNMLPQFSESDSCLHVGGVGLSFGSVGTPFRRFNAVYKNIGSDVEYVDSITEGAKFIIKSSGLFHISYSESSTQSSASTYAGIWVNGTQIAIASDLYNTANANGKNASTSAPIYLNAGDVVQAWANGNVSNNGASASFIISKVGKPNITGVDVTAFVNMPLSTSQSVIIDNDTVALTQTTNLATLPVKRSEGAGYFSLGSDGITILKKCKLDVSVTGGSGSSTLVSAYILLNGSYIALDLARNSTATSLYTNSSATISASPGDKITLIAAGTSSLGQIVIFAEGVSDHLLTEPEIFSTDSNNLVFSSIHTPATLKDAPIGTYIWYLYGANSNTKTQVTSTPSPNVVGGVDGILMYARAYNVATLVGQTPAAMSIQIGKGMKGIKVDAYKSAGKTTAGMTDPLCNGANEYGMSWNYNELTGVLTLDPGLAYNISTTTKAFVFNDASTQTTAYLVVNASKNPALVGINTGKIAARAVSSTGQSIPNSTPTIIVYDANKSYDTTDSLNAATGVFTSPEDGYYRVSGAYLFVSIAWAAGTFADIYLYKNGIAHSNARTLVSAAVTSNVGATISDEIYLKKGDTLSLNAYHQRGAATTLFTGSAWNWFSISRI